MWANHCADMCRRHTVKTGFDDQHPADYSTIEQIGVWHERGMCRGAMTTPRITLPTVLFSLVAFNCGLSTADRDSISQDASVGDGYIDGDVAIIKGSHVDACLDPNPFNCPPPEEGPCPGCPTEYHECPKNC